MNIRLSDGDLRRFLIESNRIEGITRDPTPQELSETAKFLDLDTVGLDDLRRLAIIYASGRGILRERIGMDVRVGNHFPPPGGSSVRRELVKLLDDLADPDISPFEWHIQYETLHPFMDGNGRTGRAIWAWQMLKRGHERWLEIGFLHEHYYQSLNAGR